VSHKISCAQLLGLAPGLVVQLIELGTAILWSRTELRIGYTVMVSFISLLDIKTFTWIIVNSSTEYSYILAFITLIRYGQDN
jgi:hypothetical protein